MSLHSTRLQDAVKQQRFLNSKGRTFEKQHETEDEDTELPSVNIRSLIITTQKSLLITNDLSNVATNVPRLDRSIGHEPQTCRHPEGSLLIVKLFL